MLLPKLKIKTLTRFTHSDAPTSPILTLFFYIIYTSRSKCKGMALFGKL